MSRYSRTLPLPHTLRLWDMIIAVDDPSFSFFIGLALLRRRQERLLAADADGIPEVMQTLSFEGEHDVDNVVRVAATVHHTVCILDPFVAPASLTVACLHANVCRLLPLLGGGRGEAVQGHTPFAGEKPASVAKHSHIPPPHSPPPHPLLPHPLHLARL